MIKVEEFPMSRDGNNEQNIDYAVQQINKFIKRQEEKFFVRIDVINIETVKSISGGGMVPIRETSRVRVWFKETDLLKTDNQDAQH